MKIIARVISDGNDNLDLSIRHAGVDTYHLLWETASKFLHHFGLRDGSRIAISDKRPKKGIRCRKLICDTSVTYDDSMWTSGQSCVWLCDAGVMKYFGHMPKTLYVWVTKR